VFLSDFKFIDVPDDGSMECVYTGEFGAFCMCNQYGSRGNDPGFCKPIIEIHGAVVKPKGSGIHMLTAVDADFLFSSFSNPSNSSHIYIDKGSFSLIPRYIAIWMRVRNILHLSIAFCAKIF
jgi:hypothetical protein